MRVLHCVYGMNRGGLETFIMNVYRNINREKIQFDFLVHTENECAYDREIKKMGGNIFYVPPRNKGIAKNRKALHSFFRNNDEYKIIHQHASSLSYVEPLKIAKKYNVPIRIIHGHSTKQGGNFMHRIFHSWNQVNIKDIATDYFACSDNVAEWLYGKSSVHNNEHYIINNAVDIEKFKFKESVREKLRKELNIENKLVLGHVGRFVYTKNHDFLIDIFQSIYIKNKETVLLLVGDGTMRSQIESKVKKSNLEGSVLFLGVRSDIPQLLQAMDVFVFPSYYEGLPVTLVEAQASGLSCIVSENITKQVKLTNKMKFISLKKSANEWGYKVLEAVNQGNDRNQIVIKSDFEIKTVAKNLENWYMNKSNN